MTYYIKGLGTGKTYFKGNNLEEFKHQVRTAHKCKNTNEPLIVTNNYGFIMKLEEYYQMIRNEK